MKPYTLLFIVVLSACAGGKNAGKSDLSGSKTEEDWATNGYTAGTMQDFSSLDGCGFLIVTKNMELLPINLAEGFNKNKVVHPHCQKCLGGSTWFKSVVNRVGSIIIWKYLKKFFYKTS